VAGGRRRGDLGRRPALQPLQIVVGVAGSLFAAGKRIVGALVGRELKNFGAPLWLFYADPIGLCGCWGVGGQSRRGGWRLRVAGSRRPPAAGAMRQAVLKSPV
jgi:hypothetical protein